MATFHKLKSNNEILKIIKRINNEGIYKIYYSVNKKNGKIKYNLKLSQAYLKYYIKTEADSNFFDLSLNISPLDMSYFLRKYDYSRACVTENARCGILALFLMKRYIDNNFYSINYFHKRNSKLIEDIIWNFTEKSCSFYELVEFTKNIFTVYDISDDFYNNLLDYIMTFMFAHSIDD